MRPQSRHRHWFKSDRAWYWGGLICALVAGALLRLHHLGQESLWLDEAFAVQLANSSLARIVTETAKDVHPPLYYFLLHYWVRLAGDSEAAVRMMSVVASVATIGVLFALVAKLFGRRTAAWAASLAAITPFQIEFAQEARMYALLSLLSVASLWAFVSLLEDGRDGRPRFVAALAVCNALMLYTHAYAVFVFIAEALAIAILAWRSTPERQRRLKLCALGLSLSVILFLPWLPISMRQVLQVQRGFWIPDAKPDGLIGAVVLYSGSPLLACVLSALAATGLIAGVRRMRAPREGLSVTPPVIALWLLCPIVLPFALSQVSSPIFLPKYTIAGSLAFLTLAARAIAIVPMRAIRIGIAVAILGTMAVPLGDYFDVTRKVDWRDAVASVDRSAEPGDVVFFNQEYARIPFEYYTRRSDLLPVPFLRDHDVLTDRTLRDVVSYYSRGRERVWVVLANPDDLSSLLVDQLHHGRVIASHASEFGLEIYRFDRVAAQ